MDEKERLLARLGPCCYHLLSGDQPESAISLRHVLRRLYQSTLALNLLLHQEMKRLLLAFAEQAIPAIPLKGTFLALRLYGDLGARPTWDHDVFLRNEDFLKALRLLEKLGYHAVSYSPDPTEKGFQRIVSSSRQAYLEIHLGLGDLPLVLRPDPAVIWERASPVVTDGVPCWQMEPTDELLYLCLLLAKHRFADLVSALDIHYAASQWKEEVNWSELISRAARCRLQTPVALALLYAQRWFDTPVPEEVMATLRLPRWKRWYFERLEWRGAPVPDATGLPREGPLYTWFLLILDETWGNRLAWLKHVLFPPPETLQAVGFSPGGTGYARRLLSRFGSLAAGLPRFFYSRLRPTR
ncbi:MAG: nucleotidyltransferase family protein [Nitrospirae bacterium]|nr:nucleotidyltransferase family protein [Nitrospirota bacterium]